MKQELSEENCDRCGKPLTIEEVEMLEEDEKGLCYVCSLEKSGLREHILPDKLKEFDAMVKLEREKMDKRERKPKENHHVVNMIWLTDVGSTKESKKTAKTFSAGSNKKQVDSILRLLKGNFSRCAACGGFQPELQFIYNDKHFTFTCTEMRDKDKGIETDYNKFSEWLQANGYGVEFHDKLKAIVDEKLRKKE